jgi:FixJ family two-component response regulator
MASDTRRIAVVDDDPFVLRGLRRVLRSAGFEVDAYESGVAFLMAVTSRVPQCLVLDLHMPQLSGFDVQARLLASGKQLPVIVITGNDTPAARERALALGVTSYLRKPVEIRELLAAIEAATSATPPLKSHGEG